jgi:hypothetical protein
MGGVVGMKIVFQQADFRSLFGLLCSFVTMSPYSHGSIFDSKGGMWDTTMSRGWFAQDATYKKNPSRGIITFDFPHCDPSDFLEQMTGAEYDVKGLLLWPWKKHSQKKYTCFEANYECLKWFDIINTDLSPISAKTIIKELVRLGHEPTYSTMDKLC